MNHKISIIIRFSVVCLMMAQCSGNFSPAQRAGRLLDMAEEDLSSYRDEQAWKKAQTAQKIANRIENEEILCKALLVKGKVCDYADLSETDNRNDEALSYLEEAVNIADSHLMTYERALARFIISEVYVNKNRWNNDSLDTAIYCLAGKWLKEGEDIAQESNDPVLKKKARTYKLRYLRQGKQYQKAIDCCHEIIGACSENDYLTLQQVYDQLTVLYTLVGDQESSMEAHTQNVNYMQKQIMTEKKSESMPASLLAIIVTLTIGLVTSVILLSTRIRALLSKEALSSNDIDESLKKRSSTEKHNQPLRIDDLTSREIEIIHLCVEGRSTSDIARILSISQRTVSNHKQNIYSKLCVNSGTEMLRKIEEKELIIPQL